MLNNLDDENIQEYNKNQHLLLIIMITVMSFN